MDRLYNAIEKKIKESGYPRKISGQAVYEDSDLKRRLSVKKRISRYKAGSILLIVSLFMLSACSKTTEDISESQSLETVIPVGLKETVPEKTAQEETENMTVPEVTPEEPEADKKEAEITEVNWERYFDGINGAAVVYNPSENHYQIYNRELAITRRSPCSTFKIISSLAALEKQVIVPEDSMRTWSGEVFWNEKWNRDIGFEDAFRTSCVWYYRKIIDEIGKETMQEELDRLQYGNCDISDWEGRLNTNNNNRALTGFWIESSLKISPKEQVEVLERIFGENSVYSQETQNTLKQVMLAPEQQSTDTFVYGKTGMGKAHGIVVHSWFAGFADMDDGRHYFCVYLGETEGKNVSSTKAKEIAFEIVSDIANTVI